MTAEGASERPVPLFFLSYAHSHPPPNATPRARNRHVLRFFDDLSENVAELVSRPAGADPGFMDQNLVTGDDWFAELMRNVGTCQVFVALLSGPYATCQTCALEWDAFTRRALKAGVSPPPVLPVVWAPYPDDLVPAAIHRVQRFSPSGLPNADIVARYEKLGVLGLMQGRRGPAYYAVVWRLAQSIADLHHRGQPMDSCIYRSEELRDVFQEDPE